MTHQIVIDCAPGSMRPDDILKLVLDNTDLTSSDFTITSKFFGEWTFVLDESKNDIYNTHKHDIGETMKNMNHNGLIRYGEW